MLAVWSRSCSSSAKRTRCTKRFRHCRTSARSRSIQWMVSRRLLLISIVEGDATLPQLAQLKLPRNKLDLYEQVCRFDMLLFGYYLVVVLPSELLGLWRKILRTVFTLQCLLLISIGVFFQSLKLEPAPHWW